MSEHTPSPAEGPAQGPVPEAFHRRPYSFVRRGDRLTARRQKAWDDWAPTRVLVPGGLWRLATDWQEYALVMREVLDASPQFENVHPGPLADDEHPDTGWAPRWEGRVLTSFERKAQEAGRVPRDLVYRRTA